MTNRPQRLVPGVLLVVAAVAVTSPVALVVSLWVGAGAVTVGVRDGAGAYALAGLVILGPALVLVTLWACMPGVLRLRPRALLTALIALVVLLLVLATDAWTTVATPWLPRSAVIVSVTVGCFGLAIALAARPAPGPPVIGVGVAVAGLAATYVLVGAISAAADAGIPQFPRPPWVADVQIMRPVGLPEAVQAPPAVGLAPGDWSSIHNDSWMTDAYRSARLPDPLDSTVISFFAGGDCASLLWDGPARLIAVCVSPTQVRGFVLDSRTLEPIVERQLASKPPALDVLTNFSGGGYAVLDSERNLVTPLPGGIIARFDPSTLQPVDRLDAASALQAGEDITSVVPDVSGDLWFVGRRGTVGIANPTTGRIESVMVGRSGPVDVENSFAVAEAGVAYVVTGEDLLKLTSSGGRPEIAWRLPYDRGERRKPGQTSRASGTTPTVFAGGRFVGMTDNAEPRMNVVVVDVSGSRAVEHCRVPVFAAGQSATENSLIAMGDSLFVENNYGYSVTSVVGGRTTTPGMARIDVDSSGCSLRWQATEVTIPSLVSKGVVADGAIITYSKSASAAGVDAWWFTAVDSATGHMLWRRLAGVGPLLNNHFAAGYLSPDGAFVVGTISGIVALRSGSGESP